MSGGRRAASGGDISGQMKAGALFNFDVSSLAGAQVNTRHLQECSDVYFIVLDGEIDLVRQSLKCAVRVGSGLRPCAFYALKSGYDFFHIGKGELLKRLDTHRSLSHSLKGSDVKVRMCNAKSPVAIYFETSMAFSKGHMLEIEQFVTDSLVSTPAGCHLFENNKRPNASPASGLSAREQRKALEVAKIIYNDVLHRSTVGERLRSKIQDMKQ
ncbi:hypothetical protein [Pontivivens ytuae]|uniref:Uncharacterized protein n=1 Tax=Pontivivens ytuae TaxID=2789856 RepID=A0A7S9LU96_9RHOB|nr:hypothetical protein [Pontivivens ytuae]QPH55120.1 hypothetical protein I0K15_05070 [Pontivivens ytuae]